MLYSHSISDTGLRRQENEDNFACFNSSNFEVFVVCDGMGGHTAGALASKLACESFIDFIKSSTTSNYFTLLQGSILHANQCVFQKSQESDDYNGMGTTLVVALISKNKLYFAHVGDSRLYLKREATINQLTEDHSFVQQMLKAGILNENEAKNHPRKNEITKALGLKEKIEPSICEKEINLFSGDKILLCTDGLSNMLSDDKISTILSEKISLEKKVVNLISEANTAGGFDNITASLIELKFEKSLIKNRKRSYFIWLLAPILVFISLVFYKPYKKDNLSSKFLTEKNKKNSALQRNSILQKEIKEEIKAEKIEVSPIKKIEYDLSCMSDDSDVGTIDLINFISSTRDEMIDATVVKISAKQEMEFGKKVYDELSQQSPIKKNSSLSKILSVLVTNLKNSPYTYQIYEIEDETVNAFTVGAYIFVHSGMINFTNSNDELASVIAHEINHNELGHINKKLSLSEFSKSIVGEKLSNIGQNLDTFLGASFNQKDELLSDLCGVDLMILAGFKPCATISLWKRMSASENDFNGLENLLRSHPYSSKRANCVKHHLSSNYEIYCK